MKISIKNLSRKNILLFQEYQSARKIGGIGDIWLNANECPIGLFFNLRNFCFNRYPECQPKSLILKYSKYSQIPDKNILVTRGSDEAIELLIKTFCSPKKDNIITFPPTYSMYSKIAEIYGVNNKQIPILFDKKLDILNIKLHLNNVKLIYICRPNNPTGHIINKFDIIRLLQITTHKCLVVIDEAYIEFCYEYNLSHLLLEFSHLVILRTLSKSFGLAGLRCGFTLAHSDVIGLLRKVITPYPLASPVIDIASQALSHKYIHVMYKKVFVLNQNKLWLLDQLSKLHIVKKIFESKSNFILVKFFSSLNIFKTLWDKGIIVRNQDHEYGLNQCIRISIGTKQECFHLIQVLKRIYN
ncbi:histidinol-phosphate transaminase [Buchnera aphidicola]|uniref:Histidinol-phosphate aminotransferase n=1 Tax=Buchnera aphidicola (Stegophylla sp.) TaxID=2315800 RepID=A0A4D6YA28_9GAMM|nr:histidinol-phosphate transaminase [Buchnera aphidicola (Stegophylla sp.)]QCI26259.1 histidinol-phosphate transaminase [Buchnera aphidicola (Stegophylla sp.)]